ncbi:uncharacterized protein VP01_227g6 [Puccinia sorghi]|uniref:Uncharacterized protein n=1 Tax=Puccinia sorghi TaxID=27349 RepID=A0A0L6V8B0_9BASI|nr:uncharacterized protein VP01_227g6 [Puccinia sorghi]
MSSRSLDPNKNPPIFLALTSSWNFVALKMEDETLFPAPQYEKNWERIASPGELRWKARCFELNKKLKSQTGL